MKVGVKHVGEACQEYFLNIPMTHIRLEFFPISRIDDGWF